MTNKPLDLPPVRKPEVEVAAPVVPVAGMETEGSTPVAKLKAAAGRKVKPAVSLEPELPPAAAESAAVVDVAGPAEVSPAVGEMAGASFDSPPPLPRRKLDDSVASVLREEAELEAAARRADMEQVAKAVVPLADRIATSAATIVNDTTSVGAPSAEVAQPKPADDVAAQISAVLVEDASLAQRATKGRELLPNIEEIKSTLRSGADRGADSVEDGEEEADDLPQRRRGFRSGFSLMFLAGVLLLLGYISAPRIIQMVPASEPYVRSYVAKVNTARYWLDGMMQTASNRLESDASE